jgi:hypothetical protein
MNTRFPLQVDDELGAVTQRYGKRDVVDKEGKPVTETMGCNVWVPVDNMLAALVKDYGMNPRGERLPKRVVGCER